ncbi:FtsX-like permease family protein [Corynebacterium ciconiae DSM 44920]|uniref:FtsX-like permease family protein n=1 Tax=Corynebacterium ciconiae TaxID=227319 RepID=UPI0003678365|nr:FtsX-like permease family protein [Corynebacterium ciconiae]WKD60548.1 FtsX-like permease family protein [Corynebacterium ciconiae DSM 44920]
MIVWLKDVWANRVSWLAVVLTLAVSSASCSLALVLMDSGTDDAVPLGGTILGMSLCSIVLVVAAQMRLLIDEHWEVYRSWRLVGMPGWLIVVFVLGQVAVVALVASAAGLVLVPPLLEPAREALLSDGIVLDQLTVSAATALLSVGVCAGAAVLAVLLPVRRIFRPKVVRTARWTAPLAVLLLAAVVAPSLFAEMKPDDLLGWSMGLIAGVGLLIPWLMPLVDQWTRVMGIAGANVRQRRRFSAPQILPWVLFGGLIVVIGSGMRAMMADGANAQVSKWQVFVVVLGPAIVPSVVAALSISLLMRHRIAADVRALRLAGAPSRAPLSIQVGEACALAVTAAAIVAVMAVYVVTQLNRALGSENLLTGLWWQAWVPMFAVMAVIIALVKVVVAGRVLHTTMTEDGYA